MRVLIFSICCFFISCTKAPSSKGTTTTFSGTKMTIDYTILIGDQLDEKGIEKISYTIDQVFSSVNEIFNKFNPFSEVSKFNQLPALEKMRPSKELLNMFLFAKKMHAFTEGLFDPTVESMQKIWQEHLQKHTVPLNLKNNIGFENIEIQNGTIYKKKEGIEVDFGAFAKGRCVDMLKQAFDKMGYQHFFINWGGEIVAKGEHPDKRPWTALIRPITKKGKGIPIPLENNAIATSGDYFQNYVVNKKTYFHIFHPKKRAFLEMKKNGIGSVSVVYKNCMVADALSTAIMLLEDSPKLEAFVEKIKQEYPEANFWILKRTEM